MDVDDGGPSLSEILAIPAHPHHRLNVEAELGPLHLHARLNLTAPWTIIFGPSGSGKSSLLRAACGLLPANTVEFSERSPSTGEWLEIESPRHATAVHLRSIGYAPQGTMLFPHLSVWDNIAFASTVRRGYAANTQVVRDYIELFELSALAHRMPQDLSGGERQRVNLARALAVPHARLFLLDEPFTGVDRVLRDRLLYAIQQRVAQLGVPVLSVTHDVEEALLLGAEVIRLEEGAIIAQGPAFHALAAERERMLSVLRL